MTEEHDDVARYAAAVRAALADLPEPDRDDLLEDLDSHLAEVAAESEEPLIERIGPPEEYAAELRAAYGARAGRSGWSAWRTRSTEATRALRGNWAYRHARELLGDLRPAWWVARAYLVATGALVFFTGYDLLIPREFGRVMLMVLAVWASVLLGRRTSRLGQGLRGMVLAGNTLVVLLSVPLLSFLTDVGPDPYPPLTSAYGAEQPGGFAFESDVTNIYPYSKDGEPLEDVLLYDQDGRPLVIDKGRLNATRALQPSFPIGADGRPIRNAYPLHLESLESQGAPTQLNERPRVAIPPFPTSSPSPTVSPTGSPTDEPTKEPTGEPSPSPTN